MRYLIIFSILVTVLFANGIKAQTKDSASSAPASGKNQKLERSRMNSGPANPLFENQKKSWAVGVHLGEPIVQGDVPFQLGFGYGLFVRKALGNSVSLRLVVDNGFCRGLDWQEAGYPEFHFNNALNGQNNPNTNYYTSKTNAYYNYKMYFTTGSIQLMYNINNINFMKEHPWFGLYLYGGVGTMLYNTYTNQLNANGQMYDYSTIPVAKSYKDKKATLNALKSMLDNTYETKADYSINDWSFFGRTAVPLLNVGIGMDFKVTDRIGVNVDASYGFTGSDLLDGVRWYGNGIPTPQPDAFIFGTVGVTFRLGKTDNVYWLTNPLSLPYKNLLDDRRKIQDVSDKVDKGLADLKARVDTLNLNVDSLMSDKDSDGVSDYFDMEENTPKGAIVDGAGRTIFYKDTAGNLIFNDPNMRGAIDNVNGEEKDPEGTTYKTDPDGTTYKTYPDGTVFQKNPDGSTSRKNPDGTVYKTTADGKHYKVKPDGTQEEIAYDGTSPTNNVNGKNGAIAGAGKSAKGKKYKFDPNNQGGKSTILKSDGKGGYMTPGSNSAIGYLPAIFFDTDKSFVKHDYYPEMFVAATDIKQNPKIKVKIIGHCDYRNSEAYNMNLGMRRAQAVAKILTEYFGIPSDQLILESKGKTEPLTNAKSMDALQLNRRVQFELLDGRKAIKFNSQAPSSTEGTEKDKPATHSKHSKSVSVSATSGSENGGNAIEKPAKKVKVTSQSSTPASAPVIAPPATIVVKDTTAPITVKVSDTSMKAMIKDTAMKAMGNDSAMKATAKDTAKPIAPVASAPDTASKNIFMSRRVANMNPKEAKKAEAKKKEEDKKKAKEVKKAQERIAEAQKKKEKEEEKAAKKKAKEEAKEAKKHKKDKKDNNGTDDVIQSGN